jgi:6-phosphofructokinase 1
MLSLPQSKLNYFFLKEHKMKIGLLTGGGDCPGLNAVIRAVVRKGTNHYGDSFIGFLEGWRG